MQCETKLTGWFCFVLFCFVLFCVSHLTQRDAICYYLSFSGGYKDVIKESKFYRLKRRNAEMYKIDKHFIKMGFWKKSLSHWFSVTFDGPWLVAGFK